MSEIYTVISIATSTQTPTHGQVISINAIRTDLHSIFGEYSTYVQSSKRLTDWAKREFGIIDSELEGGLNEVNALLSLATFCAGTTLVVHSVPYVFPFLSKYGIIPSNFYDTRAIAKLVNPSYSGNLEYLTEQLGGIPTYDPLESASDVLYVFEKLLQEVNKKKLDVRNKVYYPKVVDIYDLEIPKYAKAFRQ